MSKKLNLSVHGQAETLRTRDPRSLSPAPASTDLQPQPDDMPRRRSPSPKTRRTSNNNRTISDNLARKFFPVTLAAAYNMAAIDRDDIATKMAIPEPLPQPNSTPWRVPTPPDSPRVEGDGSLRRHIRGSADYYMTSEVPTIVGSSVVMLSSPFQSELAAIRMRRLRIEEEYLLEVKRQDELERIRGPEPKWYEMKSPQFHYESHKNTELLRSREDWQALLDYRRQLEKTSEEYQRAYNSISA